MKLLTKEIRSRIPDLYANEEKEEKEIEVHAKLFAPSGRWTFYITEFDQKDTLFGYCLSAQNEDFDEWSYASLQEIEGVRNRMGIKIERDLYFNNTKKVYAANIIRDRLILGVANSWRHFYGINK